MSQALPFAAALSDVPEDGPHALFSLAQLISDSVKDIRGNRAAALALSRRINEIVSIVEDEDQGHSNLQNAIGPFQDLLRETLEMLRALATRSVVSQLLHIERDKERLRTLAERVEIALEALKMQAAISAAGLLATTQDAAPRAQTLARLDITLGPPQPDSLEEIPRLPPKPALFFGRVSETQAVVDSVLSDASGHVAILGGPGLGKTTLALNVLYQPSVAARFRAHRYFVDCGVVEGSPGSLRLVAAQFGILGADMSAIHRALRFALSGAPSLLVLDNFESAWEAQDRRVDAEDTLQFLVDIPSVRLMVTMRGAERPLSVQWSRPFLSPLAPLGADEAAQVFLSVADAYGSDGAMFQLLAHVENIPLGIVLISNLAQSESLETLLCRWQTEKTRMLSSGSGETRLTSLDVSISMSIRSARMEQVPAALGLLRQLAMLPAGAADNDITLWDGYDPRALATLLRVSLVTRMPGRGIYVLASIRSFVREQIPASDDELSVLKRHYFGLAETINREELFPSQTDDVDSLVYEIPNIEALIDHSLTTTHSLLPSLHATAQLCRLHFDTGIPSGYSLLPLAIEMARLRGHQELEADLLLFSAKIVHGTGMARQTETCATQARDIYRAINAEAKYIDASLAVEMFLPPDESMKLIRGLKSRADELNDSLRSVKCQAHLGSVYVRTGMEDRAIATYGTALRMHEDAGFPKDRIYATLTARLGKCYWAVGNTVLAESYFREALTISRPLRHTVVSGFCDLNLGHMYLQQGYANKAIGHLEAASAPLRKLGSRDALRVYMLLAQTHLMRGDITAALSSCEVGGMLQREMKWGYAETLISYVAVALHAEDTSQARALLESLWAEWHQNREILRNDTFIAAEYSVLSGLVARLEGDYDAASTALIASAIAKHQLGAAADVAVVLALLAEVVDDNLSENLLSAVMLPLLHFGYQCDLANALLQSARLAQRLQDSRTARHRARGALGRYQMIDSRDGCNKASSFVSQLDELFEE